MVVYNITSSTQNPQMVGESLSNHLMDANRERVLVFVLKPGCPYCESLKPAIQTLEQDNNLSIANIEDRFLDSLPFTRQSPMDIEGYPTIAIPEPSVDKKMVYVYYKNGDREVPALKSFYESVSNKKKGKKGKKKQQQKKTGGSGKKSSVKRIRKRCVGTRKTRCRR